MGSTPDLNVDGSCTGEFFNERKWWAPWRRVPGSVDERDVQLAYGEVVRGSEHLEFTASPATTALNKPVKGQRYA